MDNYIELKLKVGGRWPFGLFFKKKVPFLFTQYAWFFAWDLYDVGPTDFEKLEQEKQLVAIAAGAANYAAMKAGKKDRYTPEQIRSALMKASVKENQDLGKTMGNSSFPEWMKQLVKNDGEQEGDGIAKKKSKR